MGARILRAGGAAGLVAGAVLLVSGAAWSLQKPEVPVPPAVSRVLEGVTAVPGAALSQPAHDDSPEPDAGAESARGHDPDAQGASESRDAYITRTCERILGQPPTGGLDKTTDPADGAAVAPGDTIEVSLTWDPAGWSGDSLHKAIDCVTVNGVFALGLSVEERPTDNDGTFETTYDLPVDVAAGDEICDQGFLSGDSSGGGFEQDRSNQVCFSVEELGTSGTTPVPAPPAETPPAETPPAEALPASPPAPAAPQPTDVLGEQLTAPAPDQGPAVGSVPPAGLPVPQVLGDTLPRTGAETRRGPALAAGVVLTLGGLGILGGTRRPRRPVGHPA